MAELLKNELGVKIISDGFDTTENGIDIGFVETNYTLKNIQGSLHCLSKNDHLPGLRRFGDLELYNPD